MSKPLYDNLQGNKPFSNPSHLIGFELAQRLNEKGTPISLAQIAVLEIGCPATIDNTSFPPQLCVGTEPRTQVAGRPRLPPTYRITWKTTN